MKKIIMMTSIVLLVAVSVFQKALSMPFQFLDPAYTAEIFAASTTGRVGMSFTDDGRLVRRQGNIFYVHSSAADTMVRMTPTIHSAQAFVISGLPASSLWQGITAAGNNQFYVLAQDGIYHVDLFGQTATRLPNTSATTRGAYGLAYHPSGNLVYNQFTSADDGKVMAYNLANNTLQEIYDTQAFNDDLVVAPTGEIFTATLGNGGNTKQITVLDWAGSGSASLLNTITTVNGADGLALDLNGDLFSNDKSGATLYRYSFAGGDFSGAVTTTLIGSGKASSGDLGTVGPDGSFYITRQNQVYNDGTTEPDWSVIRVGPGFVPPPAPAPIPAALVLMLSGICGLMVMAKRGKGVSMQ